MKITRAAAGGLVRRGLRKLRERLVEADHLMAASRPADDPDDRERRLDEAVAALCNAGTWVAL